PRFFTILQIRLRHFPGGVRLRLLHGPESAHRSFARTRIIFSTRKCVSVQKSLTQIVPQKRRLFQQNRSPGFAPGRGFLLYFKGAFAIFPPFLGYAVGVCDIFSTSTRLRASPPGRWKSRVWL